MIDSFLESWPLFSNTYLAGWMIALLLSMVGVIVVARNQIFVGAAVAEASMLGVALALVMGGAFASWLSPGHEPHGIHEASKMDWAATIEHTLPTVMAVVFAVLASMLTIRRPQPGRDSTEAMTGWVFLLTGSGAILVVAHSPHGLEEVKTLLASTLISPPAADVWLLAIFTILTVIAVCVVRSTLMLIVMDIDTAEALGVHVRRWNLSIAIWLGLVLGLSLHVAGLIFVFGCLILPALLARNLCRCMGTMFLIAPIAAFMLAVAGFIIANHFDLPFAHATIGLMAAMLPVSWVVSRVRN